MSDENSDTDTRIAGIFSVPRWWASVFEAGALERGISISHVRNTWLRSEFVIAGDLETMMVFFTGVIMSGCTIKPV